MLDFLKFLFKKKKKVKSRSTKKVCRNVPGQSKLDSCDAVAVKRTKDELIEEICAEAVRKSREAELCKEECASEEKTTCECVEQSDVTVETSAEEPAKEEAVIVPSVPDNGKYVIKLSASGIYTFALKSPKGDTIVSSCEYTLKRSCVSGIQSVRKNGVTEYVEDQTEEKIEKKPNPKYEVYLSGDEKYRFRLKAPNGYIILDSQAFVSKKNCIRAIENIKKYCSSEDVEEISKQAKAK